MGSFVSRIVSMTLSKDGRASDQTKSAAVHDTNQETSVPVAPLKCSCEVIDKSVKLGTNLSKEDLAQGIVWVTELNKMNREEQMFSKKVISQVLFDGQMCTFYEEYCNELDKKEADKLILKPDKVDD